MCDLGEEATVMKLQTIGSATVCSLLATLSGGDFPFIPRVQAKIRSSQVLAQTLTDRKAEGDRLLKQGSQQFQIGHYQAALQSYQQGLIIYREIKDRQGEENALVELGNTYFYLSNYPKAIDYKQQRVALMREIKDRQGEKTALINLVNTYSRLGDYAKATEYEQQSLVIAREIKDHEREENAKSLESKQQLLALFREIKDRQAEETALRDLGFAYLRLDNYAKGIEYFEQLLALTREIKDRQGEEIALINLINAYRVLDNYDKVIEYEQQLLAFAREIQNRQVEGSVLGELGFAYLRLGNYTKAIEYEQQLLAFAREIQNRQVEGAALGNLGFAYLRLGNYTKAIEYTQQWLVLTREIQDHRHEQAALNILGSTYLELGDYAKAIEYAQQWLAFARKIQDRQSEGHALGNLGVALYKQGNLTAAEKTLLESLQASESMLRGENVLNDHWQIKIFDLQANVYIHLQKVLIAQKKTNEALVFAEKGRARAFVQSLKIRLIPSVSDQITINPLNIQQVQQIASDQNATLVEYSIIGNEALYIWVIKPTGEITFKSVDLKSLDINLRQVTENTRVAAATGRGLNEPNTVFADMIRGTRDALGTSENNLSNQLATNRPNSTHSKSPVASQKLQQLYQLLIEPIADVLPTDPNATVIFIPHQSIFLVPFATLQNAQGQYLIEKHTIAIAPAIKILQLTHKIKQKERPGSAQNILIVGNPTMPQIGTPPEQLSALPGSEQEAKIIATLFNTQAIIGSQATKIFITQQMSKARIIHLATHGLLNEVKNQFMPGAIALAPSGDDDGFLTSGEILNLKLNAELVVLSACNTGKGELTGDGVIGLSRSFIIAGVPSILASLWSVPDAPTAELMAEFYRQLQLNPNKAQALRQAMLMTMKMHPNPQDWGAFTLIGEAE